MSAVLQQSELEAKAMAILTTVHAYLAQTPVGQRGMNLGCGGQGFKGWLNIDRDHPYHVDLRWDLCEGLPFAPDASFDYVYSEHFLEHIPRRNAQELMRESFRSLKSGGHVRIAMPDLDKVINDYVMDNKHPGAHPEFSTYFGGDLFYTKGELLDIAMRQWGHTYLYNYEDLERVLLAAGFVDVHRIPVINTSAIPMLANRETRPPTQTCLIAEGRKP